MSLTEQPVFWAKRSMMVAASGYKDMFARSYSANINDRSLVDDFVDYTNSGRSVDPAAIAGIAGRIIQPQATTGHLIGIDNGFDEKRLVFMISVEHKDKRSMYAKTTVVSGYTDIFDVTYKGTINPQTRFYINNVATISDMNGLRPIDVSHLITSKQYESRGYGRDRGMRGDGLITMRPADVLSDINNAHSELTVVDTTNFVSEHKSLKSKRTNGMASRYLSDIFRAVKSVDPNTYANSNRFGLDSGSTIEQAASIARESPISSDALTRRLRTYTEFIREGYVYWGDLCDIIDGLNEATVIAVSDDVRNIYGKRSADSEEWRGADNETLTATIINQSLSSVMATCLVTYLECEMTNETVDGRPAVRITNLSLFDDGLDLATQADLIEGVIISELFPIITHNGDFAISATVQFDLMTEAFIEVSFDGGHPVPFVAPTFCDALYSPVVAGDVTALEDISRTVSGLIDRTMLASERF